MTDFRDLRALDYQRSYDLLISNATAIMFKFIINPDPHSGQAGRYPAGGEQCGIGGSDPQRSGGHPPTGQSSSDPSAAKTDQRPATERTSGVR